MILNLPVSIQVTKKKPFYLNLNSYRNAHFFTLNKAKNMFKEIVSEQIKPLTCYSKIRLTYTLYPRTAAKSDVANICSIVDKFFSDALVELGKLEDDNYDFLPEVIYKFGSKDKLNPRVEVFIEEIDNNFTQQKENNDMQIVLEEDEILAAIDAYVRTQVNIADNQTISVDMKAGRGEHGFSATLEIRTADILSQDPVSVQTKVMPSEGVVTQPDETVVVAPKVSGGIFGNTGTTEPKAEVEPTPETETPVEEEKPKRTRRTKAQMEAARAAEANGGETTEPEPASNISETPENRQDPEHPEEEEVDTGEAPEPAVKKSIFNFDPE